MKKLIFVTIFLCLPVFLFGQEIIEKIEISGNDRVTQETILYYLSSREGGYYSPELLREDFRVLWATGFFSNIKIEEDQGSKGKIVRIVVEENPVIKEIAFKTGKKVKEDDIMNKLKEKDEYILPYSYYSSHKIKKIEETIQDLLMEKGLTAGKIKTEIDKTGNNEMIVTFDIDEGPKIRVGEIVFEGDPKIKASILEEAISANRTHGLISWVSGKDVYKQNSLDEDMVELKKKFQEHGYMEATIGEPRIEDIKKRTVFFKKQDMKKLIIPVNAGYCYFVGDVTIEGNEILSTDFIRGLIKYKKGDVYSTKVTQKAIDDIMEIYRDGGWLRVQVNPVESLDPKRKRVNIVYNIYEGDVSYLNTLEFKGNTYTKDKVIRREMMLREGDRFSLALFRDSILRISQLGLVEVTGDPEFKEVPDDPTKLDVTLNVTELQRNNIQFTAGYSGYQGLFIALSYSTVNFLGAGETLDLTLQYGKLLRNYSFGFSEPYFLDTPVTVGINLFDQYWIYPGLYNRKGRGANLSLGSRIKGYWRASLVYGLEYVNISLPDEDSKDPYYDPFYNPYYGYGGGMRSPYYYPGMYGLGNYNISSVTPTIYRNTVDSPLTPSRGSLFLLSCKLAGGPLGGDIGLVKPRIELSHFQPLVSRHVLGLHLEYKFNKKYGDNDIPFWERFFLGGERSIRGYEWYGVGPRDENGRNIGGDRSFVLNAEYIIPVGGPLYAIFFHDMGNAYINDQKLDFKNMYTSTGLELRVFVPALRIPFRLIFAYNNRKVRTDDSNYTFRFAIGTTF